MYGIDVGEGEKRYGIDVGEREKRLYGVDVGGRIGNTKQMGTFFFLP